MRGKKRKIVIPSEDEVAEFSGEAKAGPDAPASGEAETVPSEAPDTSSDDQAIVDGAGTGPSEAEQWKDKFLRAKAELANFQRRAEKDHRDALKYAHTGLARALLPVLDDLERVIASVSETESDAHTVLDGVKLTLDNFLKLLREFNVTVIEAEGQPFDPEVHEAMMQQPSDEHAEPTVLQEVTRGYRLLDRVLRPAKVIVSKPPEVGGADDGE